MSASIKKSKEMITVLVWILINFRRDRRGYDWEGVWKELPQR